MALHAANTVDVELTGGGVVTLRINLPVHACAVRLLQQAQLAVGPDPDPDADGQDGVPSARDTALTMYVLEHMADLVTAGAIVGWRGVVDEAGRTVPYHPRAVERLGMSDAILLVGEIVGAVVGEDAEVAAAAEMGAEDPTPPQLVSGSGGG